MNISIFGLGYVGAVTAGCLARLGHKIIGVDVHPQKVAAFNRGVPPIVEPGLDELMKAAKSKGLLQATLSCDEAIRDTEVSIVCVGTPSKVTGALDMSFVRGVLEQIAGALQKKPNPHAVVLRSTMLPGSTAKLVDDFLSEPVATGHLGVYYYPEFLRESTAVEDFENPSLIVLGTRDGSAAPAGLMKTLFGEKAAVVNWQTAEMVKYACNVFHATKVAFANEIGRIARPMKIDSRLVMDLLCQDTRLNLSSYYLRPGNPFGGSCLPKDVRALTQHARQHGVDVPLLESLVPSNERHLESLLGAIMDCGKRDVTVLGLSFKTNTDDLRESSMVEAAQALLARGYRLRIYDPALNLAALVGANKREIEIRIPLLASLLRPDLESALGSGGLVVVNHRCAAINELRKLVRTNHTILDVNGWPELRDLPSRYLGFCW